MKKFEEVKRIWESMEYSLEPCHDGNCDNPEHKGDFIKYDIYSHGSDMFIPYAEAEEILKRLGVLK